MQSLNQSILELFQDYNTPPMTARDIYHALGYARKPAKLDAALAELVADCRLMQRGTDYFHPRLLGYIAGTYWDSGRSFGFVTPDDAAGRGEDIFLPPHCSGKAWHGDRVLVELDLPQLEAGRQTGHVVKLIRRGDPVCQGRLEKLGKEYYVVPDSGRYPALKVAGAHSGLRKGDRVSACILSYGGRRVSPLCQVTAVFGRDGSRQAAVESILAQNHISRSFPKEVLEEANAAPQTVHPAARRGRLDLREQQIITIDGPYAKDLDDAVSLEVTETGWRLGVHIADVSHYVREGSPLDQEAFRRGTSVYFADQVVPMLPEALSNGICSLNPQVDRLTLSCIMEVDSQGQVVEHTIAKSVIRTTERMSYPDCNQLLAGTDPELAQRYAAILPMLQEMHTLSRRLEQNRFRRGALDLASSEVSLCCDDDGNPVGVARHTTGASEKIIESFMLLANETVAEHLVKQGLPGVFRIHEPPSPEKLERLSGLIAPFGYTLEAPNAFGIQRLLAAAQGTQEAPAISMALLRSLMKARYEGENLGHFGLGAEYYCHFTSPIRRYPDLMVHRILTASLSAHPQINHFRKRSAEAALQSSFRERSAETAERDAEKCYLAEYMQSRVGETFDGIVTGVSRTGLFVQLPMGAEGRVAVETMPGYYHYDEEAMTLTGGSPTQVYRFAQPVQVTCVAAHPGTGVIDLTLSGLPAVPHREGSRSQRPESATGKEHRRTGKGRSKGRHNQRSVSVPRTKKGKRKR